MHYNLSEIPDSNIQETETQYCIRSRSDVWVKFIYVI